MGLDAVDPVTLRQLGNVHVPRPVEQNGSLKANGDQLSFKEPGNPGSYHFRPHPKSYWRKCRCMEYTIPTAAGSNVAMYISTAEGGYRGHGHRMCSGTACSILLTGRSCAWGSRMMGRWIGIESGRYKD
ncbi:hypothetical protein Bbelb_096640 [Branchiostoma belcheri]|nr:hypothetical protein Bbelb_096640 [Branchiostoma belcheri]